MRTQQCCIRVPPSARHQWRSQQLPSCRGVSPDRPAARHHNHAAWQGHHGGARGLSGGQLQAWIMQAALLVPPSPPHWGQNEPQGGAARRGRAACNRSVYSIASSCQGAQLGVEETRDRQAGSTTKKTSPTAGKRVAYVISSVPSACGISSPDRGVSRCAHTAQQKAMPQQCRLACAPCAAGKVQPYRLAHRLPARPTPQLVDSCGGEHSCVPS